MLRRALVLIALASCGSQPPPGAAAAPAVARSAARPPAASAQAPTTPRATPADAAVPAERSIFSRVYSSSVLAVRPYAFPGGAVLVGGSLLAVVVGDAVRQDPRLSVGLPEYVNWDADVSLVLPALSGAPAAAGIPEGATMTLHAGNRHGPGTTMRMAAAGWIDGAAPLDPRLRRLATTEDSQHAELALPSGELFVVRTGQNAIESFVFASGQTAPTKQPVPLREASWATAMLVGGSPNAVYFCTFLGEVARWDGASWSVLTVSAGKPEACAATADGTLWVVASARGGNTLLQRPPSARDFAPVPVPGGADPETVAAAGDRVWITARVRASGLSEVYSSAPVKTPISVGELQRPAADDGAITGFTQTTVDVPSVSEAPAGPGTEACSSLVVWLGKSITPELGKALHELDDMASVPVALVSGIAPGTIVPERPGAAFMRYAPSRRAAPAVAALPRSFAEGLRLADALAKKKLAQPPRLLCATPRVTRQLGTAGALRP